MRKMVSVQKKLVQMDDKRNKKVVVYFSLTSNVASANNLLLHVGQSLHRNLNRKVTFIVKIKGRIIKNEMKEGIGNDSLNLFITSQ